MPAKRNYPPFFNLIIITIALVASAACASATTANAPVVVGKMHITDTQTPPKPSPTRLACEPLTIISLPADVCAGTAASAVHLTAHGACVCHNHAYIAVPNGVGKTCVRRHVVTNRLSQYAAQMAALGVTAPTIEKSLDGPIYLEDPNRNYMRTWNTKEPDLESARQIMAELRQLAADGPSLDPLRFQRRLAPLIGDIRRLATSVQTDDVCGSSRREQARSADDHQR